MLTLRQSFKLQLLKVHAIAFLVWAHDSEWFMPALGTFLGVSGMIIAIAA